ncbi:hypothetical protein FOZ63_029767, partial [Perkinsus olseni]
KDKLVVQDGRLGDLHWCWLTFTVHSKHEKRTIREEDCTMEKALRPNMALATPDTSSAIGESSIRQCQNQPPTVEDRQPLPTVEEAEAQGMVENGGHAAAPSQTLPQVPPRRPAQVTPQGPSQAAPKVPPRVGPQGPPEALSQALPPPPAAPQVPPQAPPQKPFFRCLQTDHLEVPEQRLLAPFGMVLCKRLHKKQLERPSQQMLKRQPQPRQAFQQSRQRRARVNLHP